MIVTAAAFSPTAGGFLLVLAIILPVAGILLSLVLGGCYAERIALGLMPLGFGVAAVIAFLLWRSGQPLVYILGGFTPPLGIALRADGFSAVMMVTAALVIPAAGFFARANFATPAGVTEARAPLTFWILLQAIWAALNIVFLGGDFFNLYVALELLTFAAVPLVCLDGRPETLAAALRYLLFALFGSVFYLLGAALLYGAFGTLDIVLLAARIHASARRLDGRRADDRGAACQDGSFPAAFMAAASPCKRARRGERRAFGAGCQSLLFSDRAALV